MLGDSVSWTWESMANWFTPTVLFLLLNLMIATIAFTSSLASAKTTVPRSANLSILHRLDTHKKSPDDSDPFYEGIESHTHYLFQENNQIHPQIEALDSLVKEPEESQSQPCLDSTRGGSGEENHDENSLSEIYSEINKSSSSSRSEEEPEPDKLGVKKMSKSASLRLDLGHSEEEEEEEEEEKIEARRPATVRERGSYGGGGEGGDQEVDARANDFINKFKHQLKLQRLDSLIRAGSSSKHTIPFHSSTLNSL